MTTRAVRAALLLACAWGVNGFANAADTTAASASSDSSQASATASEGKTKAAKKSAAGQGGVLQRQLQAVQAQLQELAQQNQALLAHQQEIDRQLAQQREQLVQQQRLLDQQRAQLAQQSSAGQSQSALAARPGVSQSAAASVAATAALGSAAPGSAAAGASGTAGGAGSPNAGGAPVTAGTTGAGGSTSALPESTLPTPGSSAQGASLASWGQNVRLWGYGELYYSDPTRDRSKAQADLARAVFGIGYAFSDRTEFNSEYEVEHAIASASDTGEFEVEQFYVDHRINDALTARAGLFLMPFGFINEHHEPTNFYGMQRNFIETLIIPSTWREGGFNLHGDTRWGFGWNVGVTTGFDLAKWNFAPEFPEYSTALDLVNSDAGPLRASHQELSLANAHDLSQYVALSYYGVPGLVIGGAISTGNAVKVPAPPNAPIPGNQRVTLWEGHVRWTPGKFDLSALYAHGSISNLTLANASNPGSPNPIPSSFYGYFVQGAYELWQQGDYRLAPFVRWERYNLGASYAGTDGPALPTGSVPLSAAPGDYGLWPQNHDRVWTAGANFYVTPHVVLKLDYQWFNVNADFNRLDLGLGLAF